jgi:ABC-type uncharacterized transport system permease subunit
MVELFFWPALLGYGEAALAYSSPRFAWLGTWGVRLGWLAQTGLLVAQAASSDGFPWSSWAASLNLFVWLVVGTYLIWGCRPRYRLLGLSVMPLAVVLFLAARFGGGMALDERARYGSAFLVLHVGLVLAAFAGFTLAAALAGIYLLEDHRLKRRAPNILALRLPSLVTLERLMTRTVAVALPVLTLGLVAGFVRLREEGRGLDTLMAVTLVTWFLYGMFVLARPGGRRGAYVVIAGFLLVILVRVALAGSHS